MWKVRLQHTNGIEKQAEKMVTGCTERLEAALKRGKSKMLYPLRHFLGQETRS